MRHYLATQERLIAQHEGVSPAKQREIRRALVRLCAELDVTPEQASRVIGVVCIARTSREHHTPSVREARR